MSNEYIPPQPPPEGVSSEGAPQPTAPPPNAVPQPPAPPAPVMPQPSAPPAPPAPAPAPRRAGREPSWAWIGGAILILLGFAVLFGNFGIIWMNWWALLLYIVAAVNLVNAARSWQRTGTFGSSASSSLTSALVLTAIASIVLLNLPWGDWWPLILVAAGVGIVLGGVLGAATGDGRR